MDKERKNKENLHDNKLTIVGGQPSEKKSQLFNTNIEKLLLKATSDEKFKEKLLNNRKEVLEDEEHSLTSQDKMLLSRIPPEKLEDMIEKFKLQKNPKKKIFKGSAITMTLLTCSYMNMFHSYRMNTLGMRPELIHAVSALSKPVVSLYISTLLFKIKQSFWRILGVAFSILVLQAVTGFIASLILHSLLDYDYSQTIYLFHTIHITLFIISCAIAIKYIFNIKWLLATGISITNSIFLLFIIPYLFQGMLILLNKLFPGILSWRTFDMIGSKIFLGFMIGITLILIYWGFWKKSDEAVKNKGD